MSCRVMLLMFCFIFVEVVREDGKRFAIQWEEEEEVAVEEREEEVAEEI